MTEKIYLNDDWEFTENFSTDFLSGKEVPGIKKVRLPHTCKETPYNYFDADIYQMDCGYRRTVSADEAWKHKRLFLVIGAAAHKAEVFLNGEKLSEHRCGYTAFKTELTQYLKPEKNLLAIRVDSNETLNQPPFGKVTDYMTYGGLYREVFLEIRDEESIEDVFAMPLIKEELKLKEDEIAAKKVRALLKSEIRISAPAAERLYIRQRVFLREKNNTVLRSKPGRIIRPKAAADSDMVSLAQCEMTAQGAYITGLEIKEALLWDITSPTLYTVTTELYENVPEDEVDMASTDLVCGWAAEDRGKGARGKLFRRLDIKEAAVGFRLSDFRKDGYYLNGRKVKIRGLNRHQSYPYAGYAMPASMQRLDADILKYELGVNAVRTSHYPCSEYFYERCDETGLLVFTEIPGWQNIGDDEWKAQAVENTKEMTAQLRNHPCIILWGVRINESADDDELYEKTNSVCRSFDPTRPTGGVRYLKNSHLLEDVYTYNDFSFDGSSLKEKNGLQPGSKNPSWRAVEAKADVTGNPDVPYLISEYNGHMFPAKTFDSEDHRTEHALRHACVLDSVMEQEDIAGSFGWCMFDYNTHKEFGSGDHICHHGVMDMFRNPKPAAAVYAACQDKIPVLEILSAMDIGEHPAGLPGRVYMITNADEIRFYKNDVFIRTYTHADSCFKNLKNGPIEITDYLGDLLEKDEGYSKQQADAIKEFLNFYARFGLKALSFRQKLKAASLMKKYGISADRAYELYGKYIGGWGDKNTAYKFEAVKDGKVVKTVIKEPARCVNITAEADHTLLKEDTTYDAAAVRICAADQNRNPEAFYFGSLAAETEGPIEIIGPKTIQLRGGYGGTYVKTTGRSGPAVLILKSDRGEEIQIEFEVEI